MQQVVVVPGHFQDTGECLFSHAPSRLAAPVVVVCRSTDRVLCYDGDIRVGKKSPRSVTNA